MVTRIGEGQGRWLFLSGTVLAALLILVACSLSDGASPPDPTATPLSVTPWETFAPEAEGTDDTVGPNQAALGNDYLSLRDYYQPRFGQPIRLEHLTTDDGLSSGSVYWITVDHLGLMWIGTSGGLDRYDGRNFVNYRHDPDDPGSLSEDHVFNILEDRKQNLWIATYGGGLERFDRDRDAFVHYRFDPDDPDSLSSNKVFVIYEDRAGTLWVGTSGGGLDRYDPDLDGFVHYAHDPADSTTISGDYVNAILEDSAGVLWIGTTTGLNRLDQSTSQFVHYQHDSQDPASLSNDSVFSILEDRQGAFWIGTSGGGLNLLDRETGYFTHYRHDPDDPNSLSDDIAFALLEDMGGTLWVGSLGGGLHQFDRENKRFIRHRADPNDPSGLSDDYVNVLFEDREGTLWIGTTSALDKHARRREKFSQFIPYKHVESVYEDSKDRVWVGTVDGLYKLDSSLNEEAFYQHDPDNPQSLSQGWVQAVFEDSQGVLWVGVSGGGLDRLDQETGDFIHHRHDPSDPASLSNDVVNVIYEDRAGTLWIGTDGGLNQFDRQLQTFRVLPTTPESPGSARVESIAAILEDRQGALWVSTWGDGLRLLDPETNQFIAYRHDPKDQNSLTTNFVSELFEDTAGRLWAGTDGGLHYYDPVDDGFPRYDQALGMPDDYIISILQDPKGYLWLATSSGLLQLQPEDGDLIFYSDADGLRADAPMGGATQRHNGQMLFGGQAGVDVFTPDLISPNPVVPPVALVSMSQDGVEVPLDGALEMVRDVSLSWPKNDFEFEFAALSYAQPEKNQYAYLLEGYDQDWNYVGTDGAGRYVNLPGGNYTLRLKGTNDNGVWNETGLAVRFTVVPPIWETWWFVGTMVLLLVGVVFAGYRLRVRNVESQSRELEAQVVERTAELSRINELLSQEIVERERAEQALAQRAAEAAVQEERSRLARDLHDAVTQTLFSASLIAETLPDMFETDPAGGEQLLLELLQLNRGAMAEMRTLLLELRPAALVEANLGDLLRQLGEAVAGRTGVPVAVTVESCREPLDQVHGLPPGVHVSLYRIAQEALNNVVKHSLAKSVEVSLFCIPTQGGTPARVEGKSRDAVVLFISDDGRGFDVEDASPDRLGLGIIRERAESIGAKLKIESELGQGTQILVVWTEERHQRVPEAVMPLLER